MRLLWSEDARKKDRKSRGRCGNRPKHSAFTPSRARPGDNRRLTCLLVRHLNFPSVPSSAAFLPLIERIYVAAVRLRGGFRPEVDGDHPQGLRGRLRRHELQAPSRGHELRVRIICSVLRSHLCSPTLCVSRDVRPCAFVSHHREEREREMMFIVASPTLAFGRSERGMTSRQALQGHGLKWSFYVLAG